MCMPIRVEKMLKFMSRGALFAGLLLLLCALLVTSQEAVADPPTPVDRPAGDEPATNVGLAAVAWRLHYQGRLADPATGNPKPDGTYTMSFRLYTVATGGSPLWTETKSVAVTNGLFSTLLGDTTALDPDVFNGQDLWLGVTVGADPEATPRQPIVYVAYALYARNADTVDGQSASAFAAAGHNHDSTYWKLTGNSNTTAGTNFLGTTNSQALELKVNSARALRLEPNSTSPNVIGGHNSNSVTAGIYGATISGGGDSAETNRVSGNYGTVGGGRNNVASAVHATVGGGHANTAGSAEATVAGGGGNTAQGVFAAVGGGRDNATQGDYAIISGGYRNAITATYGTIGGGLNNLITATYGMIGGGAGNLVSGNLGMIGGGNDNTASGYAAVIGGGYNNNAAGNYATVAGGYRNTASNTDATVGGGAYNTASGYYATVPGGYSNSAQGNYSLAAGYHARAPYDGCFIWGDASSSSDVACGNSNRWVIRSSGGVWFYSSANMSTGLYLAAGGNAWNSFSDRALKENFTPADGTAILKKVAALPVQEYTLKSQDASIRHIGPVAQDFAAAFGYGEDNRTINMEDADGVALAAIQGLYQLAQDQAARIRQLEAENSSLKQQLETEKTTQQQAMIALEQRIAALEAGRAPAAGTNTPLPLLPGAGVLVASLGLVWLTRRGGGE